MIKTCPNCGGFFCTPPDKTFAGRGCNCGYAETVTLSLADAVARIHQLESRINRLKNALRLSVDQMQTWFSSAYTEHPTTKQVASVLNEKD